MRGANPSNQELAVRNVKQWWALLALVISMGAFGQVSGTKNIPGDYADLAAAVADFR